MTEISCQKYDQWHEDMEMKQEYHFNTRFKEYRKDFRYAEGKSKFSEHVLNENKGKLILTETSHLCKNMIFKRNLEFTNLSFILLLGIKTHKNSSINVK